MDFSWTLVLYHSAFTILQLLMSPLFWLVVVLVWLQYRRMLKTKESLYELKDSSFRASFIALVYGVIGGFLGSFLMILFGVTINGVGVAWLWIIALVLMLFSPRFLCFSYAGGVLALISIIFGYPQVHIPGLMGLVAVLHLVESILILLSGHQDPLPVYVRNPDGRVVGAFNLQKFWPIPLAAMMILLGADQVSGELMNMPEWWPLIRPWETASIQDVMYQILPVVAALGYGELAVTCLPRERTKRTAAHLAGYSIVLLGLAVAASHYPQLSIMSALFSPLGHELVIYLGRRQELQGRPRFVPPSSGGVMVLDVLKGSPAHLAGIKSGDVIRSVNGKSVNSRHELSRILRLAGDSFLLEFAGGTGETSQARVHKAPGEPLGEIPVPELGDRPNVGFVMGSPFKKLINRVKKKFNVHK
ncbi:MAG: PDZ domain-containing protein [Syntrophaceticus sp.]|nr:PDZ domain-containing protein [Syntrophaceticus sp.]MDD4360749.1 PDZ domain-containing protein [Syntrophaceticus sp.]MDD4783778.1 PDZ domain-containing protein [Syntrophaceticus sp.]